MIRAEHIIKSYGDVEVLKDININIEKGQIVSIIGASGAGKTTLLQILGTLMRPDKGSIFINDTNINALNEKQLSRFRNQEVGFVFQFHHLLPEFTALENTCIPAFIAKKNKKDAEARAIELLTMLGLQDRLHNKPDALSGGEKQRVAICRALINNPSVILADEPSGNLDSKNTSELYDLIISLREKINLTFVIVTHNEQLAHKSDRIMTIQDGMIIG